MNSLKISVIISVILLLSSADRVGGQSSQGASGVTETSDKAHDRSISDAAGAIENIPLSDSRADSREKSLDPAKNYRYAIFSHSRPLSENYAATIELARISWPNFAGETKGRLAVGLNRPQYIIQKELGLTGSLDLNMDGIVSGVVSSARITIAYDLRSSFSENDLKMKIFIDRIIFKMGIPFGGW